MTMTERKPRLLSPAFTEALQYAAELHSAQVRKGPDRIPYVAHLMGVASLVLEHQAPIGSTSRPQCLQTLAFARMRSAQ